MSISLFNMNPYNNNKKRVNNFCCNLEREHITYHEINMYDVCNQYLMKQRNNKILRQNIHASKYSTIKKDPMIN